MKNNRTLFGTDGIRGLANTYPMNAETALLVGRAIGYVLRQPRYGFVPESTTKGLPRSIKVVVGKDTRRSGYMIEMALASGLCSMGIDVIMIGPLSTPGVAFVTQSMRAQAGIMISASHNPYFDNGIKIFSSDGYKLPDDMEREIERLIGSEELDQQRPLYDKIGRATRIDDVLGRYVVYLKALFPKDLDLQGIRMVLDCANGAAYKAAPLVFQELGAEVILKGTSPNGLNINEQCGALHPENLASYTVQYRADLGVALDGDGDRCILTDENGEIVDGDQIIGLCAMEMAKSGELLQNTVVTTPMSNFGLEKSLSSQGIKMLRAKVGDRYVVEEMREKKLNLGGEQSGHIIFLDHSTTGDGIVAALKVLEVMKKTGKSLSELKKQIHLLPQVLMNIKVKRKEALENLPKLSSKIAEVEKKLGNEGRIFVRFSGTEPLVRVMVEGKDRSEIEAYASEVSKIAEKELS